MTVRIGRTLAGRLLHKLVGGVNRLCTSCCTPPTNVCCAGTGSLPNTLYVTTTKLTGGFDVCGYGGTVITIFNPDPTNPANAWFGTLGGISVNLLRDCSLVMGSSTGTFCDISIDSFTSDCSVPVMTYLTHDQIGGGFGHTYRSVVTA